MRLSYANVVATLALILSLGGVSYAAVHAASAQRRSATVTRWRRWRWRARIPARDDRRG